MKAIKILAGVLGVYFVIVVAFECFVGFMGTRQADSGAAPEKPYLVIETTAADGRRDTVVAGVESDGHLYVAANHWPRGWYNRALANPDVEVVRAGERKAFRALPVTGPELDRIAKDYHLPLFIRILSGFPPRSYLRLDPRALDARQAERKSTNA